MVPEGVRGILLDVEGTTTPIAFVYETLFPYARARLHRYCDASRRLPEVDRALVLLREEYEAERLSSPESFPDFERGARYAEHLMDRDRKSTGLKMLQGIIWEEGYRSGELRSQVFDDVPHAFDVWQRGAVRLRIFSSGSVLAQRLLFRHTRHGDLTGFLEGYHDTTTGPKNETESYREIARLFALPAPAVLFLSDVVSELDAARGAGMRTGLLNRPGNPPVGPNDHPVHSDFSSLLH